MPEGNNTNPEFKSPLSSENLIHTLLKNIQTDIKDNKQEVDKKLDNLHKNVSELRSSVDKLGIDHILGRIEGSEKDFENLDKRVQKLENYHNKVLGIVSVVGFLLALSAIIVNFFK